MASSTSPTSATRTPAAQPDPARLTIVHYPHPVLKKRAQDVTDVDGWLRAVIAKMIELMVAEEGVGLAAPQVGLSLRFFVWSPEGKAEEAKAFINPVFSQERGQEEGEEGCLSLPDIRIKVVRYKALHVDAIGEQGQPVSADLAEFPARIVQHENDHLDGILLLDRMSPITKLANRKKIKEMEAAAKG